MSHKSSGRPPPIGPPPPPPPIECPLASLGRNTPSAGGGPPGAAIYHHPLSTSPVYQMTRQQSPMNVMGAMPGNTGGSAGVGGDGCGGHSDSSDEEQSSGAGLEAIGAGANGGGGGGGGGGGVGGVGQRQLHPQQQPAYRTPPPPIAMRTNYTPIEAILAYHDRLSPVLPGEVRGRQQPSPSVSHPSQPAQQPHTHHQHQHPHRHQHPSTMQQQQQQQHHHQHRHRQLQTVVQQQQPAAAAAAANTYYLEHHSNLHRINQRRSGHANDVDNDDDDDDEVADDDSDDDDDDDDDEDDEDAEVVDLQPIDDTSVYNMLRHHRHHRHPPHPHPHRHLTGNVAASSSGRHHSTERYFLEDQHLAALHSVQPIAATDSGGSSHAPPQLLASPTYLLHRPSSPSETSGSDRYHIGRGSRASPAILSHQYQQLNAGGAGSSAELIGGCKSRGQQHQQQPHHQQHQQLPHHQQHQQMTSMGAESSSGFMRFSPNLDQGYATLVSPSSPASSGGSHMHTPTMAAASRLDVSISGAGHSGSDAWQRYAKPALPISHQQPGAMPSSLFDLLDDNLLTLVLQWLESSELGTVSRVCRRFEVVAWRPTLWRHIVLKGEQTCGDRALKAIFRRLCGQSRTGCCAEVERVMLSDGCRVSDRGMQLVSRRCPELTHLQLQNCVAVTNGALFDLVTKCGNLQHLDITGCSQVTTINFNAGFDPPRRLLLQYLDLTDCCVINDDGLKTIVRNCPQLLYLYLRRCLQITDAGLRFVPSFCAALRELSVSDCAGITDFGLYELAKLGATLRYLSVAKCDQVSDAGLKVIARRCYKLRYLNARGCEAVSDDSIVVLASSCPRLRALDIGKCDVSDAGLRALAESCPNLKKLSLKNCDMITDRGVQCIAYYCRGLQQLNIQDCQVSVDGYRAVKRFCKRCVIEHTNPGFC